MICPTLQRLRELERDEWFGNRNGRSNEWKSWDKAQEQLVKLTGTDQWGLNFLLGENERGSK